MTSTPPSPARARSAVDDPALGERLRTVALRVVAELEAAPCAVIGAARWHEHDGWRYASGAAGRLWRQAPPEWGDAPPARCDDIFDLASLSKPITALTFARCQAHGWIDRQQPLGEVLPVVAESFAGTQPLDRLMAHRAGLEAHREFFNKQADAEQPTRREVLQRAAQLRRADCPDPAPAHGYPPIYSDLGYILSGAALEQCRDQALDAIVAEQLVAPLLDRGGEPAEPTLGLLGSARQLRPRMHGPRFVPTERVDWRGGVLRGVVHDENAWVLADRGSAGHAGMFGNVRALLQLGMELLDALAQRADDWLTAAQLAPLLRPRPGGSHCAGFDRRSGDKPSCGRFFSHDTFGHLGFTGTGLWLDPEQQQLGVLLTNRVHPSRDDITIRQARPLAYDGLHAALDGLRR